VTHPRIPIPRPPNDRSKKIGDDELRVCPICKRTGVIVVAIDERHGTARRGCRNPDCDFLGPLWSVKSGFGKRLVSLERSLAQ
jgi:hypothetical protein